MADQKTWLDTVHPAYAEKAPHWAFCRQSYEGGPAYFDANLLKFRLEDRPDFEDRKKRASRYNFSRQVVDIINDHLFKVAPTRNIKSAPDAVKRFWVRATKGKGANGIEVFVREVAKWAKAEGRAYVVIDVPSDGGVTPTTEADRLARGLEPYAYIVHPDDMLDIAYDEDGKILWAKVRERYREDADPKAASDSYEERYRLWERGKWSLWRKKKHEQTGAVEPEMIEDGTFRFTEVPIIIVEHQDGDDYSSPGLIDDVAYIDRDIFNLGSELTETISQQTFGQLIMPSDAFPPNLDQAALQAYLAVGKRRVLVYWAEAKTAPQYISPDASQGGLILSTIDKRIGWLYDAVNLGSEVGREKTTSASGVSKAYDFATLEGGLVTSATELESAEMEMARFVDLWTGGDGKLPEGLVAYPRSFDVISLNQALTEALSLQVVLEAASPTAMAELRKQIAAKGLDKVDEKIMQQIVDEIDAYAATERLGPPEVDQEDEVIEVVDG